MKIRKLGKILYDSNGDPAAHIIGFFYFIINLMERQIRPIFVFDGYPPREKREKSPIKIQRLVAAWKYYKTQAKHPAERRSLYEDPLFLYDKIISELQNFVRLMGCPVVRGISEGEAQGAWLVREGNAYGMISRDQDSLLFGCPRVYKEFNFKTESCIYYDLNAHLQRWGITHRQLVDIAILIGTDFNEGIKGVGPKTALQLIRKYGQLEDIPKERIFPINKGEENYRYQDFPFDIDRLRSLFLKPPIIKIKPSFQAPNTKYLRYFLRKKGWGLQRIDRGISRLKLAFRRLPYKQASLFTYI